MSQKEFTSASFNQFLGERKLMGSRCRRCGELYLPPRPICIKCHQSDMEWVEMKGKGKLAAFTAVAVAPTMMMAEGYDREHLYCTGVVELEEGPKISARILGVDAQHPETIKVGTPLTVEFVDRGEGESRRTYLGFRA